ncbi:ABC transporter ATP-binding protein [Niveispirillum fermenti]|uniref:ABC transporter ATP-binding protein n=1 Tax=Niveispirillum fermenti TaxID=1233113 RepID=UPI003A86726A
MDDIVLRLTDIHRSFTQVESPLHVLRGVNAAIRAGEMVALVGPSGAGKSTLLHIAGLLEHADRGVIEVAGCKADGLSDKERTAIRRDRIGFVYQFHHLLPEFSALENVVIPQMLAGAARAQAGTRAQELLGLVGLSARAGHRPAKLSGGEQQRVAIARALANRPRLLIADEPTGNLDTATAETVFALFADLVRGQGLGALVATHNLDLARRMDRVVEMRDGVLVEH